MRECPKLKDLQLQKLDKKLQRFDKLEQEMKLLLQQPDNGKVPLFLDYNLIFYNSCVCTIMFAYDHI